MSKTVSSRSGIRFGILAGFLAGALVGTGPVAALDDEAAASEAREIVKGFMGELVGALKGAMAEGGPVNAIDVCHDRAPAIAAAAGEGNAWDVGRTALRLRNPDNAPDAFEVAVLKDFMARHEAGEAYAGMEHYEVIEGDEGATFRYMKAIPTAGLCLACHGSEQQISGDVMAKVEDLYPADEATGFAAGELRGAFALSRPVAQGAENP